MSILFEAPVFNAESALRAAGAGVDRLELCSSFSEGGETPGVGMLQWVKQKMNIPVFVMIRPRGGNFIYTSDEIEVMNREIDLLNNAGADGFVFGILNNDHSINSDACRELIGAAGGKPCTFHRAFDSCRNPLEGLQTSIECGFSRILTSGMKENVSEGLEEIIRLLKIAERKIIIMPGGGLMPEHLPLLMETGLLQDIHASCIARKRREDIPLFEDDIFNKFQNWLHG
ncbi:copper homeostasis protein CutC [Rhodohalobacter mucosus]|uniref:PF03932 family protein CutC n=1 Tax=Rhodohalobacter mucosus TaxID=2079485 RepID=A0A316TZ73_9BACT|nr:copper homeostasis protein CutC [Rhodohalobacter mucosus]PWN05306.1 copper homeostasis protein CutC [Rhodohalobacter mucosus]